MKRILLLSVGESPQIVTETIYFYEVQQEQQIHEIQVIVTDSDGKENLKNDLLGDDGKLKQLCNDYDLDFNRLKIKDHNIHVFKDDDGQDLDDLLTDYDNQLTINQSMKLLQELTEIEDSQLIVSVAGGRKSMSVILGQFMQFFARKQDLLTHVIIDTRLFNSNFWYPTPYSYIQEIKGEQFDYKDVEIHLSEIPFIRLKPIYGNLIELDGSKTLDEFIKQAEKNISSKIKGPEITIDLNRKQLTINDKNIRLANQELALYTLVLNAKIDSNLSKLFKESKKSLHILKDDLLEESVVEEYLNYYKLTDSYIDEELISSTKINMEDTLSGWVGQIRSKLNNKLKKELNEFEYSRSYINSEKNSDHERIWGVNNLIENIKIKVD